MAGEEMSAYYNFSRLINRYSSEYSLETETECHINDMGDYVPGVKELKTLTGAIMAISESRIIRAEGAISAEDRQLYSNKELEKELIGAVVSYKGSRYRIEKDRDNSDFTGVYAYLLKRVSTGRAAND